MMEKDIVAAILRLLKKRPRCFAWKTHGGMYGTAGIPDIVACVDGRFVGLEVKQPGGKLSRLQEITLGRIRAAGGVAAMVTSVEEARRVLPAEASTAGVAEYWKQLCLLNSRINEMLVQAARLRKEGRTAEYTAMKREVDSEIDALVDLRERYGAVRKEGFYDCVEIPE